MTRPHFQRQLITKTLWVIRCAVKGCPHWIGEGDAWETHEEAEDTLAESSDYFWGKKLCLCDEHVKEFMTAVEKERKG